MLRPVVIPWEWLAGDGAITGDQLTWANRALRARHPATSEGPSATNAEPSTTVTAPT